MARAPLTTSQRSLSARNGNHHASPAERMARLRKRRKRNEILLPIVVHKDDIAEIARRGYEGAASTDSKTMGEAVGSFCPTRLCHSGTGDAVTVALLHPVTRHAVGGVTPS